jgi:membrane protein YdbS with pleckstrin-like domain
MWWALWGAIVIGVISLIGIALEPRRVRSIGYRLREDDLVFRRGIMFQRQVAVPYGRMQLVDITRGPVARALGLADHKFVTAAAATAVTVPGLPMEEADRLRDELVALAETRRAGL